jgi:DNA uptake protein ComE-like DNA-binding protein
VIVAYREQHGLYTQADDLLKIKIFNEEWLERLKPYLEF